MLDSNYTQELLNLQDVLVEKVENLEKTFKLPGGVYNFGSANTKSTYETVYSLFNVLQFNTSLLKKISYDKPRNLAMSQEKLNNYGIYFPTTEERLIHCLKGDFHE